MTSTGASRRGRPTGRRQGDSSTRDAILAAARRRFAEHGFTRATIRAIAADAGVDPALVMHYYGNKADLFAASVQLPILPSHALAEVTAAEPSRLGEMLLRTLLGIWSDPDGLDTWLSLFRAAATDEQAATTFREFLTDVIVHPISQTLDDPDAEHRVWLVASHMLGLGVARHVLGIEPLASASDDDLVATIAPTLQHYLTGDLPLRHR